MKQFILVALIFSCFRVAAADDITPRLDSYQTVSVGSSRKEGGFLQYIGHHGAHEIIVLSHDTGSAVPTEDLRIYMREGTEYRLLMQIPMLLYHGFRCSASGNMLSIVLVKTYSKTDDGKKCITIDLDSLVNAAEKT